MKTTPEDLEILREWVNEYKRPEIWEHCGLSHQFLARLLDDFDELIKSNAILSMWTCSAANVCDEAKNHEEARKATETCMKDLNEEIRTLRARAEKAEAERSEKEGGE